MGIFKQPKAPNPYQVAQAQTQSNKETAIASQELNMVGQDTPYGSLAYEQTGTSANGNPLYTARVKLSPEEQAALQREQAFDKVADEVAATQLGRVKDTFSSPFSLDNEATEARLMELGRKRLDPMFSERRADLEAEAVNRGFRPGTEAYNSVVGNFERGRNDAYNQLALTGRQQAVAEALAERNQPLKELATLLGYGQVDNPDFVATPKTSVANTDIAGLVSDNYKNQTSQYNAMLGGLFGLGGNAMKLFGKGG